MTEQNDLVGKLKKYDAFLTRSIEDERRISDEESIRGSVAANQRIGVYCSAQQELYRLFPDIKSKQD